MAALEEQRNLTQSFVERAGAIVPAFVLVLGIISSLALWSVLNAEHYRSLKAILDARAHAYSELLDARIDGASSSLVGASQWWTALNGTPQGAWSKDVHSILGRSPALSEIQWIDRDLNVRWRATRFDENYDAADEYTLHQTHTQRLREAIQLSQEIATVVTDANHPEGSHIAIFVPVTRNGEFDGFLRGTIDLRGVVAQTYRDLALVSHVRVMDGNVLLHEVGERPLTEHPEITAISRVDGPDHQLHLHLAPNTAFFAANQNQQTLTISLVVLIAAGVIAFMMRQYTRLLRKDVELHTTALALQSSEAVTSSHAAHLESIYAVVPIGLGMLDLDLKYTFVNERLSKMSNLTPDEHVGRTPMDVNPKLGERLLPFMRYVIEAESPLESVEIVETPLSKDDHERYWVCSFHVAYDAKEQKTGIVVAFLDITTLKEAEQENQDLSKKLFITQKTEALGRLTGGVAHDFNNMLGVILGSLEFVREKTASDPEISTLVDRIELAAEHSADLIRQLLAFARRQPLVPRNVQVDQSMRNLLPLLRRSITPSIEISLDSAADVWIARVDESQLGSAVLNLVINARDAMPDGGNINIELANAVLDENYTFGEVEVVPGEYVVISVSDTGTGMSKETVAQAFEPFFTTKESGKGSGLGLSMVFGFVKQSKGHTKIYSELGVGTVVKMYLPRADGELTPTQHGSEKIIRGDEKILVVEDDKLMRETATRQLRSLGYTVIEADGGEAALDVLDDHADIELLFTDVVMPGGMNGPELAQEALARRPDLKVMFVSGYTDNALIDRGWLGQGVELLQKPYRRVDLAAKVRKALRRTQNLT